MLITRKIAKETNPIGLQAVSGVMAVCIIVPLLAITTSSGIDALTLMAPSAFEWTMLWAIGALGTMAHLLMTWSLRYAPSATLAPMQYLEIPIATVIGFWVFQDLPNGMAAVGIAITVTTGVYIILRERAISRDQALSPEPT